MTERPKRDAVPVANDQSLMAAKGTLGPADAPDFDPDEVPHLPPGRMPPAPERNPRVQAVPTRIEEADPPRPSPTARGPAHR